MLLRAAIFVSFGLLATKDGGEQAFLLFLIATRRLPLTFLSAFFVKFQMISVQDKAFSSLRTAVYRSLEQIESGVVVLLRGLRDLRLGLLPLFLVSVFFAQKPTPAGLFTVFLFLVISSLVNRQRRYKREIAGVRVIARQR